MIRRRKFLVNKPVQLRYLFIVVVPLIILLSGLYYLMYYSVFNQILIPEAIVATLLPAMRNVNIVLLIAIPLALLLIIRLALIYSNRVVGPLPRLEKDLDKFIAGDNWVRLKVRDNDELSSFVNKVNILFEKVKAR